MGNRRHGKTEARFEEKKTEALERNTKHAALSRAEKLASLPVGGAKRQRARLAKEKGR